MNKADDSKRFCEGGMACFAMSFLILGVATVTVTVTGTVTPETALVPCTH
jgi:hypothetical protein